MNWFDIECKQGGGKAVIHIFDEIGAFGVSANQFVEQLKAVGNVRELELHINSPGGSVFDGLAIYNLLKRHSALVTVFIDGLAASIASVVVMAGDTVIMPENALMMMHRPTAIAAGDVDDLNKTVEILEKTEPSIRAAYRNKTGLSDARITEMLAAETWLSATEAVELGFADRIEKSVKIAASFNLSNYKHPPGSRATPTQQRNGGTAVKTYVDPIGTFNERAAAVMKRSSMLRSAAVTSVVNADPALHRQFLVATNDKIGRHAAVDHLR